MIIFSDNLILNYNESNRTFRNKKKYEKDQQFDSFFLQLVNSLLPERNRKRTATMKSQHFHLKYGKQNRRKKRFRSHFG